MTSALITASVAQQESDTRKAKFWSVTEYSKNLSSQCNMTAQKEQVQDKILCQYFTLSIPQSTVYIFFLDFKYFIIYFW